MVMTASWRSVSVECRLWMSSREALAATRYCRLLTYTDSNPLLRSGAPPLTCFDWPARAASLTSGLLVFGGKDPATPKRHP